MIEYKSRGEKVRALQQILKQVGYDAGSFDGIYGKKLNAAFEAFDAAHGLTFEVNKVRPADVDALVNAWLALDSKPMSEGSAYTPVNLALNVVPSSDKVTDENATTYIWTVTNLGSEKCMFNAILLNYGRNPDFSKDNLVMVIDGEELKRNADNHVSGSFTVAKEWGDGNLNFAAMAVDEKTGEKWLSNTVVFESAGAGEPQTVAPQEVDLNVAALADGTYAASFDRGDIASVNSGIYMNAVTVYTMDTYSKTAVRNLAEGDTLVVSGESIPVTSVLNEDGVIMVNGGLSADGINLVPTADGKAWRVQLYDDMATYTERGETTLKVDTSANYFESSRLIAGYSHLVEALLTSENDSFTQYNTTVTIAHGSVVKISRVYIP